MSNMLIVKKIKTILVCALSVICVIASASQPESEKVNSDENDNAVCSAAGLKKLHTNFLKLAGNRYPEHGWNLTRAMICLKGPEADKIVRRYITGDLMMKVGGTGGGQDFLVAKESDEVNHGYGRGEAWQGTVELQGNNIWVNFMTDEICWKGFTIRFNGRKWNISELNSGCD